MLVQDFLAESAARLPDKVALVQDTARRTYAELDQDANRLAHALRDRGVARGDRVAIFLPNGVEAVVAIFGILKAGACFVVVNPSTKADKLIYILNDCGAAGLIVHARHAPLADAAAREVPSLKVRVFAGRHAESVAAERPASLDLGRVLADCPPDPLPCTNIDRDLACLIYTSGSTGFPKGVMSDHSNVAFAAGSIITYLENVEDDVILSVLPLSFDYGLYQLLMTVKFGGRLVLERGFVYPAAVLQALVEERATGFPIVPTILAMVLQMDLGAYDLAALRYVSNTGAALPPAHTLELQRRLPGLRIYSMYGLTETKRTLYLPPEQLTTRPDSVGIAIPGTEVWLEDDDGNRLGPGSTGELVIRGRHVMRGYWNAPDATAARFRPGPLPGERVCYSGDLFRMDDEGYLYFVGRQDDIIKSRGEKIAPKEIENVLYQMEGVTEAAVVGVPDPIMGQAIKAYLVCPGNALTRADVLAHCRAHLEDLMLPREIEFRDALPKTSSGKISKRELA